MEEDFDSLFAKRIGVGNLYSILARAPALIIILKGEDHVVWLVNSIVFKLLGRGREILDKPLLEVMPELKDLALSRSSITYLKPEKQGKEALFP